MSSGLVTVQPIKCANCGSPFSGMPKEPWCSDTCADELRWKQQLFDEGKDYYPYEWSRFTEKDRKALEHLQWLRGRLVKFHGDAENVDFIITFDEIIERLKGEWIMTP